MSLDSTGPAPETREPRFLWLLFSAGAAPLAWLGQVMLAYGVTSYACYPGDHPVSLTSTSLLRAALFACDGIALLACVASALVSWRAWNGHAAKQGHNGFLALWGLMSSLWFFAAVLFNIIASIAVPPCLG